MVTVVHFFIAMCVVEGLFMLYYLAKGKDRTVTYNATHHGLALALNVWLILWAYGTLPGSQ